MNGKKKAKLTSKGKRNREALENNEKSFRKIRNLRQKETEYEIDFRDKLEIVEEFSSDPLLSAKDVEDYLEDDIDRELRKLKDKRSTESFERLYIVAKLYAEKKSRETEGRFYENFIEGLKTTYSGIMNQEEVPEEKLHSFYEMFECFYETHFSKNK